MLKFYIVPVLVHFNNVLNRIINELEKDNPKVCCKGEEFTAFTIPQWADSIKNKNKDG